MQGNDFKIQRWYMITNPHAGPMVGMMPFAELEIMEHCMLIDHVRAEFGGPYFSPGQMKDCYRRFRFFCRDQWDNRN